MRFGSEAKSLELSGIHARFKNAREWAGRGNREI